MTTAIHATGTMRCRWLYATGCAENGFISDSQRAAHENTGHEAAELTVCPVCGEEQWRAPGRAVHMSRKHGIRAGTMERFNADAAQIEAIWKDRHPGEPSYRDEHPDLTIGSGQEADVIPMPPANGLTVVTGAAEPVTEPAVEPAPEPATAELPGMPLPSALDQIAVLVAEMLAAEDAYRDHARAQKQRAEQIAYLASNLT